MEFFSEWLWKVYDRMPPLKAMEEACGDIEVRSIQGWIRHAFSFLLLCFLICRCIVVFFKFPLCFALQGHSINDSTGVTFTELVYPEVYACVCVCFLSAGITSLLGSGVYTAAYPLHDVSITCQHGHRKHSKCRWDNLARV